MSIYLATLAAEISTLHDAANQAAMSAVQYAAKCGQKLIEAKAACQHGEWLPWLEGNCRVNQRQSQRYMKLAKEMPNLIDSNDQPTNHFTGIEAAIAYLSTSDETKEKVESAEQPVTESQIKAWERERKELQEQVEKQAKRSEEWRKQYLF